MLVWRTWPVYVQQLIRQHYLSRPAGSFVAGILDLVSERSTMSLRWLCRVRRPEVCLQESACDPLTSTTDPQIHRRCWCQDEGRRLSSRLHHPISTRRRRWGWHAASRRCVCFMPRVVEPCRMCRYGVPRLLLLLLFLLYCYYYYHFYYIIIIIFIILIIIIFITPYSDKCFKRKIYVIDFSRFLKWHSFFRQID